MGAAFYRTTAPETTATYQAPATTQNEVVAFAHHRVGNSNCTGISSGEVNAKAQLWRQLPAPNGLTVSLAGGGWQAQLSWNNHHNNRDTDSTEIYRNGGAGWQLAGLVNRLASSFTDAPPFAGTWSYFVRHVTGFIHYPDDDASDLPRPNSPGSASVSLAIGPPPPTGLLCTGRFTPQMDCHWFYAVSGDSTQVWRRKPTTANTLVKTLAPGVQTWVDSGVQLDTTYIYQVRHREAGLDGAFSTADTTVASPIAPENLSCGGPNGQAIIICSWVTTLPTDTVEVWREGWKSAWQAIANVSPGSNSFADSSVVLGKLYSYAVRYRRGTTWSPYSNYDDATGGAGEPYGPQGP